MKKLIFFAIILVSFQGLSQKPEELVRWLKTYRVDSYVQFDTTGLSQLLPGVTSCQENNEKDWSDYHVADLNEDGFFRRLYAL
jgi:hypothetical protein